MSFNYEEAAVMKMLLFGLSLAISGLLMFAYSASLYRSTVLWVDEVEARQVELKQAALEMENACTALDREDAMLEDGAAGFPQLRAEYASWGLEVDDVTAASTPAYVR